MPLVHFFETSFSRTYERQIVIVEVVSEGLSGWGEITAGEHPFYNEEWTASAWLIAGGFVAPRLIGRGIADAGGRAGACRPGATPIRCGRRSAAEPAGRFRAACRSGFRTRSSS